MPGKLPSSKQRCQDLACVPLKSQTADVFTIRDYRAPDFDRLWEIDQLCFATGISYTQMELSGFLHMRGAIALVAEYRETSPHLTAVDRIAGFVVANRRNKVGRIVTIDVLPGAQGLGLGTRLMGECEKRLRDAGCAQAYLEAAVNNEAALRLYHKLGYEVVRVLPKYYSSHALDAFRLAKRL
jgi:ribosomal-protein-alanine N-acetyltransferase